jgi:hypothetical protein
MVKLAMRKPDQPLDAAGLLSDYGVRPVPDREAVALAAARDGQLHAGAAVGQPDIGLGRIEAEGQGMLTMLNHGLDQQLQPIDEELARRRQEIDRQARAVEDARQRVAEKAAAKEQLLATLEASAVANGRPLHRLGLRRLSTRVYLALLAVLGLADAIFNATALLATRERAFNVWILALALMVALLFVSHVAGTELRAAEERGGQPGGGRRRWLAVVSLVTIAVSLLAIGTIRAAYLAEHLASLDENLSGGVTAAVFGLQFLVAVAAVAAAYYHADPDAAALRQAQAELEQAGEDKELVNAELGELWVELKEQQIAKVYTVLDYLWVGETALTFINELKFLYLTVYLRTLQAASQPVVQVAITPTPQPEWMQARRRWVDQQQDVDPASDIPGRRRELPPPAA